MMEKAAIIRRSLLFVPADSARKMEKAASCPADALILDLEDSVAPPAKDAARALVLERLRARSGTRTPELWVRINALDTPLALIDLAAVMVGAPDGILLPKSNSAADIVRLDHFLSALETREGIAAGSTPVIAIATETASSLFTLGGYAGAAPRLAGMTWGAEDLSAALGASGNKDETGAYDFPYQLARTLCLAGAVAAEIQPLDGVYPDFRDLEGLRREALAGRRMGFTGKFAIHPDQVPVINEAFTPGPVEIEHARRIIEAFAQNPGAGVIAIEGRMVDMPHLKQARRVLELARALENRARTA